MRKFLILAIILLSLEMVGNIQAATNEAANPEAQPVTIYGKSGSGIDIIRAGADDKKSQIGSGQIYTGACRLLSVDFTSATAGDTIGIYDTTDSSYPIDTIEFELTIAANTSTLPYDAKGAPFVNGIRILSTNANSFIGIVFDY